MSKKIIIRANEVTGEIKVETQGFKGKGCMKATQFLEEGLGGGKVTKSKEFYETEKFDEHHTVET